jgi:hypothetical protein
MHMKSGRNLSELRGWLPTAKPASRGRSKIVHCPAEYRSGFDQPLALRKQFQIAVEPLVGDGFTALHHPNAIRPSGFRSPRERDDDMLPAATFIGVDDYNYPIAQYHHWF